jgi:hypothetical protein
MSHIISICIFMINLYFCRHDRFSSVKTGYERHYNECAAFAMQVIQYINISNILTTQFFLQKSKSYCNMYAFIQNTKNVQVL